MNRRIIAIAFFLYSSFSIAASPPAAPQPTPPATPAAVPAASTPASINTVPTAPIPLAPLSTDTGESTADYTAYLKSKYANAQWDALVKEGFTQFSAGQAIQAVDFLQKAVALGCASPFVYFMLAASYEFLGNPYTAVQYYALAEKDIASLPKGHDYLTSFNEHYARALLANNQQADAIPYLEKIAKTTQQYWVLSTLGDYYLSQNKIDDALPVLLHSVEVPTIRDVPPPQIAQVYVAIAKIYYTKGDKDNSYRYLTYAVQTDPGNQEATSLHHQLESGRQSDQMLEQIEKLYRK